MKIGIRRWMIGLFLSVLVAAVPILGGCNKRPDPRDNPDFNEEAIDPSTIQMGDMGGKDDAKE